jgi:hypothetical protein
MNEEKSPFTVFLLICIGLLTCVIIYGIYDLITYEPTKVQEATQKTLQYVGFDGKKHQAIVVLTAQHNWVLVEKK